LAVRRDRESTSNVPTGSFRLLDGRCPFRDGADDPDMIGFLERAHPERPHRRTDSERQDWHTAGPSLEDTRHEIRDSWSWTTETASW
jgi:hypothetical protein